MSPTDKPVVWLCDKPESPPLSSSAQDEAGWLIRQLQQGETNLPESKKVKTTSFFRIRFEDDEKNTSWRIYYRVDEDAVIVIDICAKNTQQIPKHVMARLIKRLKAYDEGNK